MATSTFSLDTLNIDDLLTADELVSIDAGAVTADIATKGLFESAPDKTPGYTEATIVWSQIP